ncbi:MAG: PLP-dependent aminotransferase family protein [Porticoccaceae bacterium]
MAVELLINLEHGGERTLQKQIVDQLAYAIINGAVALEQPLPSSRVLSAQLGVGRNTVILAYQSLLDDGYLISRERSGYFVNPELLRGVRPQPLAPQTEPSQPVDWSARWQSAPSDLPRLQKPSNWQHYPYPFIYGQISSNLFPVNHWRECSRDAVSVGAIRHWSAERLGYDDPLLVAQVRSRLLPRRGVIAEPENILITVGTQQGLALIAQLLWNRSGIKVGVENPGYVDLHNLVKLSSAEPVPLPIDDCGVIVGEQLKQCDYLCVTPSHQSPTTVTMPLERRKALLAAAAANNTVIIEDDYEGEFNYLSRPLPALKSMDVDGRVIYLGSLSKTLSPGIRLGYMVASKEVIEELRALRRLMVRHPAANNQHTLALFLERGYYDSLIGKLYSTYAERYAVMKRALAEHLPQLQVSPSSGGSSFWLQAPQAIDTAQLAEKAAAQGIIIEPGQLHFLSESPPKNTFRMGFSAVPAEQIETGIRLLSEILAAQ